MMPLTCPRCGAQNPEDMAFCQHCGTALTSPGAAPPPAPAMPAAPPPGPVPAPLQTSPAPLPAVAAHRLPLATILGLVVGLLGLLAAGAIVFGHQNASPTPPAVPTMAPLPTSVPAQPTSVPAQPTNVPAQPTSVPAQPTNVPAQPTSVPAQPTNVPAQPTAAAAATDTPAPPSFPTSAPAQPTSPPVQPTSPPVQPTSPPVQPAPGGQPITTSMFSLQVPPGWQLVNQSPTEVLLQDPSTAPNSLDIVETTVSSPTTVQSVLQVLIGRLQKVAPDAQPCGQGQSETIGGIQGTVIPVCFTLTPQGSASITAAALVWAATSSSGSTVFAVERVAAQSNQAFFTNSGQVLSTLQWAGGQ